MFQFVAERVGVCLLGCTACHVRLVGHFDFHSASIVYHAVGYVVFVIILAIDSDAVNIYVAAAVFRSVNNELSAVFQVERDFLEQWRSEYILVSTWRYRIEAHCGENVPCGCLAVVFIAAVAVGGGCVHAVHDFAQPVLGLPGFSSIVVQIDHVLDGLVAVCIVAHVHHCHLTDFVDGESVVAVIVYWRYSEYGVKHADECFFSTHQVDESLRVVEYRPCIVPAVAFGEGVTPLSGENGAWNEPSALRPRISFESLS